MGAGSLLCDSCKSEPALIFCRPDTAYLCIPCDAKVHAANKLASRHGRVWVCEVCEQAPATITCKADAAHLCPTCDRDIHSANSLASRHDRVVLLPFYDPILTRPEKEETEAVMCKLFGEEWNSDTEEAEAASWLLSNPSKVDEPKSIEFLFNGGCGGEDPYLGKVDPDLDGVVPDPDQKVGGEDDGGMMRMPRQHEGSVFCVGQFDGYENNSNNNGCKNFEYSWSNTQASLSHSISSSSLDFGVVPDASAMADVASTGLDKQMKIIGMDREARVLRYREKRKNRKFEKTIRYASRKAYAETRPRIKGRFAKRTDVEAEVSAASVDGLFATEAGYGVVPTF